MSWHQQAERETERAKQGTALALESTTSDGSVYLPVQRSNRNRLVLYTAHIPVFDHDLTAFVFTMYLVEFF